MTRIFKRLVLLSVCLGLTACQTAPEHYGAHDIPVDAPKSIKIGKPYSIKGKTYYPAYRPNYDETGIASWYGPGFHGKKTANGEVYDQYAMTAAHPTLPLPSIVRVTNVKNGRTTVVRINDRGPFAHGRIIDLSKRAAETIGIKGIAKVRVEYLKEDTERYWASSNTRPRALKGVDLSQYAADKSPSFSSADPYVSQASGGSVPAQPAPIISVSSTQVADLKPIGQQNKAAYINHPQNPPPNRHGREVLFSPQNRNEHSDPPIITSEHRTHSHGGELINPPPSLQGYFIQAGAFSSKQNANRLRSKLAHLGTVFIDHIQRSTSILYRVRVGPYASHDVASDNLHEVYRVGIKDATIVAVR